jgi:predicted HicB family RNase H-like nuclease
MKRQMKKREKENKEGEARLLHIRVSEEIHKRLRIRAAELDTSMQDVVEQMIERELGKKKEG